MNYIKQLELENFQKHSSLILDFIPNTNIIHGASDVGKSCIRRALEWVYFNKSLANEGIRKENTKKTSVKITLSNGIIVERVKSNSINRYILIVDKETKEFNAIGKEIPEEIKKILQVRTIKVDKEEIILNISNQIALPFLLDKSGAFRMKLFNQLTGCNLLDKAFSSLNKDILHVNKIEKLEKEHLIEQNKKFKEVKIKQEETKFLYQTFSELYKQIRDITEKHQKLNNYLENLNKVNKEITNIDNNIINSKIIEQNVLNKINNFINKLDIYLDISNKLSQVNNRLQITQKKLKQIKLPDINIKRLTNKIIKLEYLNDIKTNLNNTTTDIDKLKLRLIDLNISMKKDEKKYKKILKEFKICPLCKTKITDTTIKGIVL